MTEYNKEYPTNLSDCQTKTQLFAYYLYKYLSLKNDIDIILYRAPTKGKSISHNRLYSNLKMQNADHIILIQNKGFYGRNKKFKACLSKFITGSMFSLTQNNFYLGNEDMLFYVNRLGLKFRNNTTCIGWASDCNKLIPNQDSDSINILIGNNNNKIMENVKNFINKNNDYIDIILSEYTHNNYDGNIILRNYEDRYDILKKADIYIITTQCCDYNLIFDLAMLNCVIISPNDYLHREVAELLDVITYTNDIPWEIVIDRLNTVNTRQKLIKLGYTWENAINIIYNNLNDYKINNKQIDNIDNIDNINKIYDGDKINNNRSNPNKIYDSDKINKNRSTPNKIFDRNDSPAFFQSKLRLK